MANFTKSNIVKGIQSHLDFLNMKKAELEETLEYWAMFKELLTNKEIKDLTYSEQMSLNIFISNHGHLFPK